MSYTSTEEMRGRIAAAMRGEEYRGNPNPRRGANKRLRGSGNAAESEALEAIDGDVPAKVLRYRERLRDWRASREEGDHTAMDLLLDVATDVLHVVEDIKKMSGSLSTADALNLLVDNVREQCYTQFYAAVGGALDGMSNPLLATDPDRLLINTRHQAFNDHWEGIRKFTRNKLAEYALIV